MTATFAERLAGVKAEMLAEQTEQTDNDFWHARPYLKHIRDAAHARQRSAPAVLGVTLARVAALVDHRLRIPPIVGADAGLSLISVILAPPGVGKSTANHIGAALLPAPEGLDVADQLPLGTGEGLVETFYGTVDEEDPETGKKSKVRRQVRHNAFVFVDEGQVVGEIGNRKGATLLPTIRTAFTGGTMGNANASEERRRIVPGGSYTLGIVVAMQTSLAGALLDDAEGGTPQRMLWLSAIDPTIPDVPPAWPGPLPWQPPDSEKVRDLRGDGWLVGEEAFLGVAQTIQDEIRLADLARARGEVATAALDAHEGLLRLKLAALLAILDGRLSIDEEDWQLAAVVKAMSDRMRDTVEHTVEQRSAKAEADMSARLARRAVHQVAAVEQRRVVDCARKVAEKVWGEPDRWTRKELFGAMRRYRDVLDDGLNHAVAEGWVTEVVEPGHGDRKRSIRPGMQRVA